VRIVGHRGAAALAPENTIAAFDAGVAAGVDDVEFDVQRTRDGVPIVIHDDTLDRTTPLHGAVAATDWASIRAGAPDVPSLDDLCAWAASRSVGLVLELKQRFDARDGGLVPVVLPLLRSHGLLERTVVISFDHASLEQLHRLAPEARTAPLFGRRMPPEGWPAWSAGIHPFYGWVTPELCVRAHDGGQYVHAWGFEPDRESVARLVSAGVDSLSADDPSRLVQFLSPS
jgi:glycerophosphoryl diester phosphodiesterase